MSKPLDLTTDWHTHTSTTDGEATIEQMVLAATHRGLTRLHLTDHVRATSDWLPDYIAEVRRVRATAAIEVVCGVEAKILDVRGRVDLPPNLRGIEQVVVSDHQFPTRLGPVTPTEMRRRIAAGEILASDAVAELILATSRAVFSHERVVVGHLFSILPKSGIALSEVTGEMLATLAAACRTAGAVIEVNEKWRTPSIATVRAMCGLGVDFVPSSDAHTLSAVGGWDHVAQAADAVVP